LLLAGIWDKAKDTVGVIPAGHVRVRRAADEIEDRLGPWVERIIIEVWVLVATEIGIIEGGGEWEKGEENCGAQKC
jgi:hypothetical protein